MPKFGMVWSLRKQITKDGECQMRKNKVKTLAIILTCGSAKKDAYEWINKWNIGSFLQIKDTKTDKCSIYKLIHREFSMSSTKHANKRIPSYVIKLEYVNGSESFFFGRLYEFTSILQSIIPDDPLYKLYQWKVNIPSSEVLIAPPREFSHLKVHKNSMAIKGLEHRGEATIKMKKDTLVVTTATTGIYMIELWAKPKTISTTRKSRLTRHNITKKLKKVRDKILRK